VVIFLGIVAYIISMDKNSVLWSSWIGWTTLGIMGMPIIIGLYWERATKEGAIAGLVSGFTVLVLWNVFSLTEKLNIFHALPAGLTAILVTFLVSLLTSKPPEHIWEDLRSLKKSDEDKDNVEVFEIK
jgi:Na+/proline symporter